MEGVSNRNRYVHDCSEDAEHPLFLTFRRGGKLIKVSDEVCDATAEVIRSLAFDLSKGPVRISVSQMSATSIKEMGIKVTQRNGIVWESFSASSLNGTAANVNQAVFDLFHRDQLANSLRERDEEEEEEHEVRLKRRVSQPPVQEETGSSQEWSESESETD